jgi:predicted dinucleotide-binding enzyme
MKIGIIGAGNMGVSLARFWVKNGHTVMLSFSRDPAKLRQAADIVGKNASVGSPTDAVKFGDVILLSVPWSAAADAIKAAGSLAGKVVFSCVNALNTDMSNLAVGTTTSAAEEIAKHAPKAKVVEALPAFAELLATGSTTINGQQGTAFYCGDDPQSKSVVAGLVEETGVEAVDAGPLTAARFIEPAMMLLVKLAHAQGMGGRISYKLLR